MIRDLFILYSRTYFLPDQRDFLARGLIFGDDSQLSQGMKDLFQGLGLSHFTAASGSNLRLFLPSWLRRISVMSWMSVWALCELIGVLFYLHLAHLSPSLWRAFIFWFVAWVGRFWGRRLPMRRALLWLIFITLFMHKNYFGLLGFQLSFLCMVSIWFSQAYLIYEKNMRELKERKCFIWIRDMFRDSVCIFLFLTPLLYYRFGEIVPMGIVGTMVATIPLQVFTQLSLVVKVLPQFFVADWLLQMIYRFIAGIFFCLWFVDLSVFHVLVWLGILIGIWRMLVQVQRERGLWRTIQ